MTTRWIFLPDEHGIVRPAPLAPRRVPWGEIAGSAVVVLSIFAGTWWALVVLP